MDEELTDGYREPCAQCSSVDWGISDEGRYYCRCCHNVIERTQDVVDANFTPGSSRVSTLGKGRKSRASVGHRQWMVCEGFQFILMNQAQALLQLGVSPFFKDEVLCRMWRLYLQRTNQAYTNEPLRSTTFKVRRPDSDTAESSGMSQESDNTDATSPSPLPPGSCSDGSQYSGSSDASSYLTVRQKRCGNLMSMRKTLALLHLALVWSRQPLTLSHLLRLVMDGHIPYVTAYEELPDDMRLEGRDALIFRDESIPSHRKVHREAELLLQLLQPPAFPPVGSESELHPALLSLRYLWDANLPNELHLWVCRLIERAGLADETLHSIQPASRFTLPRYDLQAAALIILTMKLLFGLDDHTEWQLSDAAAEQNHPETFSLRRWYRLLAAALQQAQGHHHQDVARKQWKANKPLCSNRTEKSAILKRKRVAEQVQLCFQKLSSEPSSTQHHFNPSGFWFRWGDGDEADGPSLHHLKLAGAATLSSDGALQLPSSTYWHLPLRACPRNCMNHYSEVEPTLPRSFVWLLQLFSFLLQVSPAYLYQDVLRVERRILGGKIPAAHPPKRRRRTDYKTKTTIRKGT